MPKIVEPLTIDVTPADLLEAKDTYLGEFLEEIDRQWPQGRRKKHNGKGTRIGSVELYFDSEDVLHMHFTERGSYLARAGALRRVPKVHLSQYAPNPVFNQGGLAGEVGNMLMSKSNLDPNDPLWEAIGFLIQRIAKLPKPENAEFRAAPSRGKASKKRVKARKSSVTKAAF